MAVSIWSWRHRQARVESAEQWRRSGRQKRISAAGVSLATFLALTLVAIAFLPHAAQAGGVQAAPAAGKLRIVPAVAEIEAGQILTVEVWLEDAASYYGLDLRLSFDPAVAQVPSGRVVPLWDVFDSANHFAIKNEARNVGGTMWYAVTNINPAEAFTGTGRVCAIAFNGVASGTTALHFTYAKGSTRDGEGLYPTTVDGQVVVRAKQRFVAFAPLVLGN